VCCWSASSPLRTTTSSRTPPQLYTDAVPEHLTVTVEEHYIVATRSVGLFPLYTTSPWWALLGRAALGVPRAGSSMGEHRTPRHALGVHIACKLLDVLSVR
jgi:hypothetical protein